MPHDFSCLLTDPVAMIVVNGTYLDGTHMVIHNLTFSLNYSKNTVYMKCLDMIYITAPATSTINGNLQMSFVSLS